MTELTVKRPDGTTVVETWIDYRRWRTVIHMQRFETQRYFYGLVGILAIGSGAGTYYTAPKDSEVSL